MLRGNSLFFCVFILSFGVVVPVCAELIDRGGGLIYDTDLDITWLKDANYDGSNAAGTWGKGMTWADNLVYYDAVRDVYWDDWRLPRGYISPEDPDNPYGYNVGEMGHLFYDELGNTYLDPTTFNAGPFIDLYYNNRFWTSTMFRTLPPNALIYGFWGFQDVYPTTNNFRFWAVRDGDVGPAPSPTADAGGDQVVFDEVTLDGSGSYDTYGTIVSFDWLLQHRDDPDNDRTAAGVNPTISSLEPDFYDVTLTVTNDDGLTGTDTMLLAVAGSCDCVASTMHIQSIIAETAPAIRNQKYGKVTVTIYDDCGNPVSGADVTGTFSGDYDQTITGTTGPDGTAVITTSASAKKPSYMFCVELNGVSHGTLTYAPNDNIEDCKSK